MSDTTTRNRYAIAAIFIILAIVFAAALVSGGSTTTPDTPATNAEQNSTLEHTDDDYTVYEDHTNVTIVEYPDEMTKTIYWADRTVCTRWQSAQEGGVACLPFNQTNLDERYNSTQH